MIVAVIAIEVTGFDIGAIDIMNTTTFGANIESVLIFGGDNKVDSILLGWKSSIKLKKCHIVVIISIVCTTKIPPRFDNFCH